MTTTTGFLTTETAQHPLQTRGRWAYLVGYVLTRLGLAMGVLGAVASLSGRLGWAALVIPGFALSKTGRWMRQRAWWHVADSRAAEPPRWRLARVMLTVATIGAALAVAATWLPRWACAVVGLYFAIATITLSLQRWSTRGRLTQPLADGLAEGGGLLIAVSAYFPALDSGQTRWAIAAGLAVAIVVSLLPTRSLGLLVSAGGMRETTETKSMRDVHGQDMRHQVVRYVAGDRRVLLRYRSVLIVAALGAWIVLAAGALQTVAALVGGAVLLATVGGLAWLASDPALRR